MAHKKVSVKKGIRKVATYPIKIVKGATRPIRRKRGRR